MKISVILPVSKFVMMITSTVAGATYLTKESSPSVTLIDSLTRGSESPILLTAVTLNWYVSPGNPGNVNWLSLV